MDETWIGRSARHRCDALAAQSQFVVVGVAPLELGKQGERRFREATFNEEIQSLQVGGNPSGRGG